MPRLAKTIKYKRFKGVNNVDVPEDVGDRWLQKAVNLDLTDKGQLRKRPGAVLEYPGSANSIFATVSGKLFYVKNGNLYRNHTVLLGSGFNSPLHYVEMQGKVYFTSTTRSGIIDGDSVVPWVPGPQNRLRVDGWEDEYGNSFDMIEHNAIFFEHGPRGHLLARHAGRMYLATGNSILFTDPLAPLLWAGAGFSFNRRVTAILPIEDGLWVCADALYWISGNDPTKMQMDRVENGKGIEGTAARVPGNRFPIDNAPAGDVWLFTTENGVVALKTNGFLANVTEDTYEIPYQPIGSAGFIETGGINRYVVQMDEATTSRAVTRDAVSVRIIRNAA